MSSEPREGSGHFYLAEKLERAPPDFPLAEAFCPAGRRAVFRALFTLKVELDSLLGARREPDLVLPRASWWQEEWARLAAGEPRHPLTRELGRLGGRRLPGLEPVLAHFAAAQAGGGERTVEDLMDPARALGALLGSVEARLLGAREEEARCAVWEDVATADLLLALPGRLRREEAGVPLDLGAELQLSRQAALADPAAMDRLLGALADRRRPGALRPASGGDVWVYRDLVELRLRRRAAGRPAPGPLRRLRRAWAGAREVRRRQ